jgi:hypothetical protein
MIVHVEAAGGRPWATLFLITSCGKSTSSFLTALVTLQTADCLQLLSDVIQSGRLKDLHSQVMLTFCYIWGDLGDCRAIGDRCQE